MTDENLGAEFACSNANVSAFPAPRLDPGVPPFDPNSLEHTRLWNSTWRMVEAEAARIMREHSAGLEPAPITYAPPAYLVKMPETWPEAVAQVEELNAAWDALDLEDEDESARVSDMHDRTMLALLRTPAPDAAGVIFKIRELHGAGRIGCDGEALAQICSEIAAL